MNLALVGEYTRVNLVFILVERVLYGVSGGGVDVGVDLEIITQCSIL